MSPLDLIIWAGAFAVASLLVGVSIAISYALIAGIRKEMKKRG